MLRDEIRQAMFDLQADGENGLKAKFTFPPSFTGFQGHFPGQPVLPGVCSVQAVLVMLEARRGRPARLRSLLKAKFYSAVAPNETLQFSCRETSSAACESLVKASAFRADRKMVELSLQIAYDPYPETAR